MTEGTVQQQFDALKNRRVAPAVRIPPTVNQFHSGTNIPGNVPYWYAVDPVGSGHWFLPSANSGADDWVQRFQRVRDRIEQFSIHADRSEVTLVQCHCPGRPSTADAWLLRTRNDGARTFEGFCLEPAFGCGCREMAIPADNVLCPWSFDDVSGNPICLSNAEPRPGRLGLNRRWRVDHCSGPLERLIQEASDVLLSMPGKIAADYWALWPQGFLVGEANYIWVDLLFEHGWRTGRVRRTVSIESPGAITRLPIRGTELFPRVDSVMNHFKALGQVIEPQESFRGNGIYVNGFVSTIDDIVSESIRLLDEILAGAAERLPEQPNGVSSKAVSVGANSELKATDPEAKDFQDEKGDWVHRAWLDANRYDPRRVSDECKSRWISRETAGRDKGRKKVTVWNYGDVVKVGMKANF